MELFTLLVNPESIDAERVTKTIRKALDGLPVKSGVELKRVPLAGGTGIVCDMPPASDELRATARQNAAVSLASIMIEAYEDHAVQRCIAKELDCKDREGFNAVLMQCEQMLSGPSAEDGGDAYLQRRVSKLAGAIAKYLEEQAFLHVEGFLRFRAETYVEELRETVAYAVDEWLMERQYQEFISLLKYFVYVQEAKIPAAHVIHHGSHDFTVLNDRMLPIDTKQMDEFVVELLDQDINHEDVIVSTLITVSPGKLYLHTHSPEEQVIKTILTIFEERAELCADCEVCYPMLKEVRRHSVQPE